MLMGATGGGSMKGSFQNSDYKVSKEKLGAYVGDGP